MIFLVKLFGQASFGKLKKLSISFDGQLVDQLGIKEAETAQDLVSILQSSCSSLVELNLNTLRRGGGEMFAVGEGSLNKFWQAEPLVFPYLDRVNVNNRAVNHYLERSHTPMKGHSRNEMIKKRSQEKVSRKHDSCPRSNEALLSLQSDLDADDRVFFCFSCQ